MPNICVVHEPTEIDTVDYFIYQLQKDGSDIELICKDDFPIADAMFSFFHKLSTIFERTFILISSKADSILSTWISKELAIQHKAGNFTNIYPTFASTEDIQEWWFPEDVTICSRA